MPSGSAIDAISAMSVIPSSSARSGSTDGVSSVTALGSAGGTGRAPLDFPAAERPGRTAGGETGSSPRGTSTGGSAAPDSPDRTEVAVSSRASSGSCGVIGSAESAAPVDEDLVRLRRPLPRGRFSVSSAERKGSSPS